MNTLSVENQTIDTEYIILENIYDASRQPLRQRDLAQIAGTSLGMTNSIVKRLAQKGWITVKKLNSRNFQYAVTLEGINEIIHRSYRYFKRTIRNVVYFKDILEDMVSRAKHKNVDTVILLGQSDLDFIVEHACRRLDMSFKKFSEDDKTWEKLSPQALVIYAEGIPENQGQGMNYPQNVFFLSGLIIKQAARTESAAYEN